MESESERVVVAANGISLFAPHAHTSTVSPTFVCFLVDVNIIVIIIVSVLSAARSVVL